MELYRLDISALPPEFYRVQHPGCRTIYDEDGLRARDTASIFTNDADLHASVYQAFLWSSATDSPFVAVFSDKSHAENWALRRSETLDADCQLITVKTTELGSVHVFKLSTLVHRLGIALQEGASQHEHGAYLCLHRIPANALVVVRSTSEIKRGQITQDAFTFPIPRC